MPPASKDTTLNAAAHAKGKPFRLTDFFSTLLEVGVPIRDVQATVNHASVTTTETYAHTAKKHRNSASLRVRY